jgi:hypothetical protein
MRRIIIATAGLFIGGAGVLALAAPAFAADTPVTVEITGGDLSISVPGSADLGTATAGSEQQDITGNLGDVLVSDQRASILGWTASAFSSNFTGEADGNQVLSASTVAYAAGSAVVVGRATVTATDLTAMDTESPVQTASDAVGVNTASWNPTITVPVPADVVADTYGATITHSVI